MLHKTFGNSFLALTLSRKGVMTWNLLLIASTSVFCEIDIVSLFLSQVFFYRSQRKYPKNHYCKIKGCSVSFTRIVAFLLPLLKEVVKVKTGQKQQCMDLLCMNYFENLSNILFLPGYTTMFTSLFLCYMMDIKSYSLIKG